MSNKNIEIPPYQKRVTFRLDEDLHHLLLQLPRSKQGVPLSVIIRDILLEHVTDQTMSMNRKTRNKINK